MTVRSIPHSQWPKPYLLKVLDQAVKEGCIRLQFAGDKSKAESFIGAINRIRRRSDKQHAHFIIPEYHLVTTTWEQERGTLLVTYSSLPDGHALPGIESVSDGEKVLIERPQVQPATPEEPVTDAPGPVDPEKLIDELLSKHGID